MRRHNRKVTTKNKWMLAIVAILAVSIISAGVVFALVGGSPADPVNPDNPTDAVVGEATSGMLNASAGGTLPTVAGATMQHAAGTVPKDHVTKGTEITTLAGLQAWLAGTGYTSGTDAYNYAYLSKDIAVDRATDVNVSGATLGSARTLDGNGYSIVFSGESTWKWGGFDKKATDTTISAIGMANSSAGHFIQGLVLAKNEGTIKNLNIKLAKDSDDEGIGNGKDKGTTATNPNNIVGTLAGWNAGTIENCSVLFETGSAINGCICGQTDANYRQGVYTGGIAGYNTGTISYSTVINNGSIKTDGGHQAIIGGIAAVNNGGTIEYCTYAGTGEMRNISWQSTPGSATGGIVGFGSEDSSVTLSAANNYNPKVTVASGVVKNSHSAFAGTYVVEKQASYIGIIAGHYSATKAEVWTASTAATLAKAGNSTSATGTHQAADMTNMAGNGSITSITGGRVDSAVSDATYVYYDYWTQSDRLFIGFQNAAVVESATSDETMTWDATRKALYMSSTEFAKTDGIVDYLGVASVTHNALKDNSLKDNVGYGTAGATGYIHAQYTSVGPSLDRATIAGLYNQDYFIQGVWSYTTYTATVVANDIVDTVYMPDKTFGDILGDTTGTTVAGKSLDDVANAGEYEVTLPIAGSSGGTVNEADRYINNEYYAGDPQAAGNGSLTFTLRVDKQKIDVLYAQGGDKATYGTYTQAINMIDGQAVDTILLNAYFITSSGYLSATAAQEDGLYYIVNNASYSQGKALTVGEYTITARMSNAAAANYQFLISTIDPSEMTLRSPLVISPKSVSLKRMVKNVLYKADISSNPLTSDDYSKWAQVSGMVPGDAVSAGSTSVIWVNNGQETAIPATGINAPGIFKVSVNGTSLSGSDASNYAYTGSDIAFTVVVAVAGDVYDDRNTGYITDAGNVIAGYTISSGGGYAIGDASALTTFLGNASYKYGYLTSNITIGTDASGDGFVNTTLFAEGRTLDGNGYTITINNDASWGHMLSTDLPNETSTAYAAMYTGPDTTRTFAAALLIPINQGTIKNLKVVVAGGASDYKYSFGSYNYNYAFGVVAGINDGTIENVGVEIKAGASLKVTGWNGSAAGIAYSTGGLVGINMGTVSYSTATINGTLTSYNKHAQGIVGGLVGLNYGGTIEYCIVKGSGTISESSAAATTGAIGAILGAGASIQNGEANYTRGYYSIVPGAVYGIYSGFVGVLQVATARKAVGSLAGVYFGTKGANSKGWFVYSDGELGLPTEQGSDGCNNGIADIAAATHAHYVGYWVCPGDDNVLATGGRVWHGYGADFDVYFDYWTRSTKMYMQFDNAASMADSTSANNMDYDHTTRIAHTDVEDVKGFLTASDNYYGMEDVNYDSTYGSTLAYGSGALGDTTVPGSNAVLITNKTQFPLNDGNNYYLVEDVYIDVGNIVNTKKGVFTGSINGNGYAIHFVGSITRTMTASNETLDTYGLTHYYYGILTNMMVGTSSVKNLTVIFEENCSVEIYFDNQSADQAGHYVGLGGIITGKLYTGTATSIENVKIDIQKNAEVTMGTSNDGTAKETKESYVGMVAGELAGGTSGKMKKIWINLDGTIHIHADDSEDRLYFGPLWGRIGDNNHELSGADDYYIFSGDGQITASTTSTYSDIGLFGGAVYTDKWCNAEDVPINAIYWDWSWSVTTGNALVRFVGGVRDHSGANNKYFVDDINLYFIDVDISGSQGVFINATTTVNGSSVTKVRLSNATGTSYDDGIQGDHTTDDYSSVYSQGINKAMGFGGIGSDVNGVYSDVVSKWTSLETGDGTLQHHVRYQDAGYMYDSSTDSRLNVEAVVINADDARVSYEYGTSDVNDYDYIMVSKAWATRMYATYQSTTANTYYKAYNAYLNALATGNATAKALYDAAQTMSFGLAKIDAWYSNLHLTSASSDIRQVGAGTKATDGTDKYLLNVSVGGSAKKYNLVSGGNLGQFIITPQIYDPAAALYVRTYDGAATANSSVNGQDVVFTYQSGGNDVADANAKYQLVTAEPSDWADSYLEYYTKTGVGSAATYAAVTGNSAPAFELNKYYAISAFGTPYSVVANVKVSGSGNLKYYDSKGELHETTAYYYFVDANDDIIQGAYVLGIASTEDVNKTDVLSKEVIANAAYIMQKDITVSVNRAAGDIDKYYDGAESTSLSTVYSYAREEDSKGYTGISYAGIAAVDSAKGIALVDLSSGNAANLTFYQEDMTTVLNPYEVGTYKLYLKLTDDQLKIGGNRTNNYHIDNITGNGNLTYTIKPIAVYVPTTAIGTDYREYTAGKQHFAAPVESGVKINRTYLSGNRGSFSGALIDQWAKYQGYADTAAANKVESFADYVLTMQSALIYEAKGGDGGTGLSVAYVYVDKSDASGYTYINTEWAPYYRALSADEKKALALKGYEYRGGTSSAFNAEYDLLTEHQLNNLAYEGYARDVSNAGLGAISTDGAINVGDYIYYGYSTNHNFYAPTDIYTRLVQEFIKLAADNGLTYTEDQIIAEMAKGTMFGNGRYEGDYFAIGNTTWEQLSQLLGGNLGVATGTDTKVWDNLVAAIKGVGGSYASTDDDYTSYDEAIKRPVKIEVFDISIYAKDQSIEYGENLYLPTTLNNEAYVISELPDAMSMDAFKQTLSNNGFAFAVPESYIIANGKVKGSADAPLWVLPVKFDGEGNMTAWRNAIVNQEYIDYNLNLTVVSGNLTVYQKEITVEWKYMYSSTDAIDAGTAYEYDATKYDAERNAYIYTGTKYTIMQVARFNGVLQDDTQPAYRIINQVSESDVREYGGFYVAMDTNQSGDDWRNYYFGDGVEGSFEIIPQKKSIANVEMWLGGVSDDTNKVVGIANDDDGKRNIILPFVNNTAMYFYLDIGMTPTANIIDAIKSNLTLTVSNANGNEISPTWTVLDSSGDTKVKFYATLALEGFNLDTNNDKSLDANDHLMVAYSLADTTVGNYHFYALDQEDDIVWITKSTTTGNGSTNQGWSMVKSITDGGTFNSTVGSNFYSNATFYNRANRTGGGASTQASAITNAVTQYTFDNSGSGVIKLDAVGSTYYFDSFSDYQAMGEALMFSYGTGNGARSWWYPDSATTAGGIEIKHEKSTYKTDEDYGLTNALYWFNVTSDNPEIQEGLRTGKYYLEVDGRFFSTGNYGSPTWWYKPAYLSTAAYGISDATSKDYEYFANYQNMYQSAYSIPAAQKKAYAANTISTYSGGGYGSDGYVNSDGELLSTYGLTGSSAYRVLLLASANDNNGIDAMMSMRLYNLSVTLKLNTGYKEDSGAKIDNNNAMFSNAHREKDGNIAVTYTTLGGGLDVSKMAVRMSPDETYNSYKELNVSNGGLVVTNREYKRAENGKMVLYSATVKTNLAKKAASGYYLNAVVYNTQVWDDTTVRAENQDYHIDNFAPDIYINDVDNTQYVNTAESQYFALGAAHGGWTIEGIKHVQITAKEVAQDATGSNGAPANQRPQSGLAQFEWSLTADFAVSHILTVANGGIVNGTGVISLTINADTYYYLKATDDLGNSVIKVLYYNTNDRKSELNLTIVGDPNELTDDQLNTDLKNNSSSAADLNAYAQSLNDYIENTWTNQNVLMRLAGYGEGNSLSRIYYRRIYASREIDRTIASVVSADGDQATVISTARELKLWLYGKTDVDGTVKDLVGTSNAYKYATLANSVDLYNEKGTHTHTNDSVVQEIAVKDRIFYDVDRLQRAGYWTHTPSLSGGRLVIDDPTKAEPVSMVFVYENSETFATSYDYTTYNFSGITGYTAGTDSVPAAAPQYSEGTISFTVYNPKDSNDKSRVEINLTTQTIRVTTVDGVVWSLYYGTSAVALELAEGRVLDGNGNTIKLQSAYWLGTATDANGNVKHNGITLTNRVQDSNATVLSSLERTIVSGSFVAYNNGTIKNVTFDMGDDIYIRATQNTVYGLVAGVNNGTISGVTLNIGHRYNVHSYGLDYDPTVIAGGLVGINSGYMAGNTVTIGANGHVVLRPNVNVASAVTGKGNIPADHGETDFVYGGLAGVNSAGVIENNTLTNNGTVTLNTVEDLANSKNFAYAGMLVGITNTSVANLDLIYELGIVVKGNMYTSLPVVDNTLNGSGNYYITIYDGSTVDANGDFTDVAESYLYDPIKLTEDDGTPKRIVIDRGNFKGVGIAYAYTADDINYGWTALEAEEWGSLLVLSHDYDSLWTFIHDGVYSLEIKIEAGTGIDRYVIAESNGTWYYNKGDIVDGAISVETIEVESSQVSEHDNATIYTYTEGGDYNETDDTITIEGSETAKFVYNNNDYATIGLATDSNGMYYIIKMYSANTAGSQTESIFHLYPVKYEGRTEVEVQIAQAYQDRYGYPPTKVVGTVKGEDYDVTEAYVNGRGFTFDWKGGLVNGVATATLSSTIVSRLAGAEFAEPTELGRFNVKIDKRQYNIAFKTEVEIANPINGAVTETTGELYNNTDIGTYINYSIDGESFTNTFDAAVTTNKYFVIWDKEPVGTRPDSQWTLEWIKASDDANSDEAWRLNNRYVEDELDKDHTTGDVSANIDASTMTITYEGSTGRLLKAYTLDTSTENDPTTWAEIDLATKMYAGVQDVGDVWYGIKEIETYQLGDYTTVLPNFNGTEWKMEEVGENGVALNWNRQAAINIKEDENLEKGILRNVNLVVTVTIKYYASYDITLKDKNDIVSEYGQNSGLTYMYVNHQKTGSAIGSMSGDPDTTMEATITTDGTATTYTLSSTKVFSNGNAVGEHYPEFFGFTITMGGETNTYVYAETTSADYDYDVYLDVDSQVWFKHGKGTNLGAMHAERAEFYAVDLTADGLYYNTTSYQTYHSEASGNKTTYNTDKLLVAKSIRNLNDFYEIDIYEVAAERQVNMLTPAGDHHIVLKTATIDSDKAKDYILNFNVKDYYTVERATINVNLTNNFGKLYDGTADWSFDVNMKRSEVATGDDAYQLGIDDYKVVGAEFYYAKLNAGEANDALYIGALNTGRSLTMIASSIAVDATIDSYSRLYAIEAPSDWTTSTGKYYYLSQAGNYEAAGAFSDAETYYIKQPAGKVLTVDNGAITSFIAHGYTYTVNGTEVLHDGELRGSISGTTATVYTQAVNINYGYFMVQSGESDAASPNVGAHLKLFLDPNNSYTFSAIIDATTGDVVDTPEYIVSSDLPTYTGGSLVVADKTKVGDVTVTNGAIEEFSITYRHNEYVFTLDGNHLMLGGTEYAGTYVDGVITLDNATKPFDKRVYTVTIPADLTNVTSEKYAIYEATEGWSAVELGATYARIYQRALYVQGTAGETSQQNKSAVFNGAPQATTATTGVEEITDYEVLSTAGNSLWGESAALSNVVPKGYYGTLTGESAMYSAETSDTKNITTPILAGQYDIVYNPSTLTTSDIQVTAIQSSNAAINRTSLPSNYYLAGVIRQANAAEYNTRFTIAEAESMMSVNRVVSEDGDRYVILVTVTGLAGGWEGLAFLNAGKAFVVDGVNHFNSAMTIFQNAGGEYDFSIDTSRLAEYNALIAENKASPEAAAIKKAVESSDAFLWQKAVGEVFRVAINGSDGFAAVIPTIDGDSFGNFKFDVIHGKLTFEYYGNVNLDAHFVSDRYSIKIAGKDELVATTLNTDVQFGNSSNVASTKSALSDGQIELADYVKETAGNASTTTFISTAAELQAWLKMTDSTATGYATGVLTTNIIGFDWSMNGTVGGAPVGLAGGRTLNGNGYSIELSGNQVSALEDYSMALAPFSALGSTTMSVSGGKVTQPDGYQYVQQDKPIYAGGVFLQYIDENAQIKNVNFVYTANRHYVVKTIKANTPDAQAVTDVNLAIGIIAGLAKNNQVDKPSLANVTLEVRGRFGYTLRGSGIATENVVAMGGMIGIAAGRNPSYPIISNSSIFYYKAATYDITAMDIYNGTTKTGQYDLYLSIDETAGLHVTYGGFVGALSYAKVYNVSVRTEENSKGELSRLYVGASNGGGWLFIAGGIGASRGNNQTNKNYAGSIDGYINKFNATIDVYNARNGGEAYVGAIIGNASKDSNRETAISNVYSYYASYTKANISKPSTASLTTGTGLIGKGSQSNYCIANTNLVMYNDEPGFVDYYFGSNKYYASTTDGDILNYTSTVFVNDNGIVYDPYETGWVQGANIYSSYLRATEYKVGTITSQDGLTPDGGQFEINDEVISYGTYDQDVSVSSASDYEWSFTKGEGTTYTINSIDFTIKVKSATASHASVFYFGEPSPATESIDPDATVDENLGTTTWDGRTLLTGSVQSGYESSYTQITDVASFFSNRTGNANRKMTQDVEIRSSDYAGDLFATSNNGKHDANAIFDGQGHTIYIGDKTRNAQDVFTSTAASANVAGSFASNVYTMGIISKANWGIIRNVNIVVTAGTTIEVNTSGSNNGAVIGLLVGWNIGTIENVSVTIEAGAKIAVTSSIDTALGGIVGANARRANDTAYKTEVLKGKLTNVKVVNNGEMIVNMSATKKVGIGGIVGRLESGELNYLHVAGSGKMKVEGSTATSYIAGIAARDAANEGTTDKLPAVGSDAWFTLSIDNVINSYTGQFSSNATTSHVGEMFGSGRGTAYDSITMYRLDGANTAGGDIAGETTVTGNVINVKANDAMLGVAYTANGAATKDSTTQGTAYGIVAYYTGTEADMIDTRTLIKNAVNATANLTYNYVEIGNSGNAQFSWSRVQTIGILKEGGNRINIEVLAPSGKFIWDYHLANYTNTLRDQGAVTRLVWNIEKGQTFENKHLTATHGENGYEYYEAGTTGLATGEGWEREWNQPVLGSYAISTAGEDGSTVFEYEYTGKPITDTISVTIHFNYTDPDTNQIIDEVHTVSVKPTAGMVDVGAYLISTISDMPEGLATMMQKGTNIKTRTQFLGEGVNGGQVLLVISPQQVEYTDNVYTKYNASTAYTDSWKGVGDTDVKLTLNYNSADAGEKVASSTAMYRMAYVDADGNFMALVPVEESFSYSGSILETNVEAGTVYDSAHIVTYRYKEVDGKNTLFNIYGYEVGTYTTFVDTDGETKVQSIDVTKVYKFRKIAYNAGNNNNYLDVNTITVTDNGETKTLSDGVPAVTSIVTNQAFYYAYLQIATLDNMPHYIETGSEVGLLPDDYSLVEIVNLTLVEHGEDAYIVPAVKLEGDKAYNYALYGTTMTVSDDGTEYTVNGVSRTFGKDYANHTITVTSGKYFYLRKTGEAGEIGIHFVLIDGKVYNAEIGTIANNSGEATKVGGDDAKVVGYEAANGNIVIYDTYLNGKTALWYDNGTDAWDGTETTSTKNTIEYVIEGKILPRDLGVEYSDLFQQIGGSNNAPSGKVTEIVLNDGSFVAITDFAEVDEDGALTGAVKTDITDKVKKQVLAGLGLTTDAELATFVATLKGLSVKRTDTETLGTTEQVYDEQQITFGVDNNNNFDIYSPTKVETVDGVETVVDATEVGQVRRTAEPYVVFSAFKGQVNADDANDLFPTLVIGSATDKAEDEFEAFMQLGTNSNVDYGPLQTLDYVLGSDITLTDNFYSEGASKWGTAAGIVFDGAGHTVYGLKGWTNSGVAGLFSATQKVTIKNVTFKDVALDSMGEEINLFAGANVTCENVIVQGTYQFFGSTANVTANHAGVLYEIEIVTDNGIEYIGQVSNAIKDAGEDAPETYKLVIADILAKNGLTQTGKDGLAEDTAIEISNINQLLIALRLPTLYFKLTANIATTIYTWDDLLYATMKDDSARVKIDLNGHTVSMKGTSKLDELFEEKTPSTT